MAARSQKVVKCLVKSSEPPRGRGDRVRATIPIAHLVLPNRIFLSDTFFYLFIFKKIIIIKPNTKKKKKNQTGRDPTPSWSSLVTLESSPLLLLPLFFLFVSFRKSDQLRCLTVTVFFALTVRFGLLIRSLPFDCFATMPLPGCPSSLFASLPTTS
jgi:hypothetical protein